MSDLLEISADEYHADDIGTYSGPYLSASIANLLINRSPRHAWEAHPKLNPFWEPRREERFDVGTALHALLLEGRNAIHVVEYTDWRTKDAKEQREQARAHGFTPLLRSQWDELEPLFDAFRYQLEAHNAEPQPFTEGVAEVTLVWEESSVRCKARLDWLRDDRLAVDDLKTTRASAEPRAWTRTMLGAGMDVAAAFYLRGLRQLGCEPAWRWVVVEVEPPFALSVCTPDAAMLAIADDKVERALAAWRRCLGSGEWPGYGTELARLEPPPWAESQWLERREEVAA